jgi:hypothetical protein
MEVFISVLRERVSRGDEVINHLKLSYIQPKCKQKRKMDEAAKQNLLSLLGGVDIEQGGEQRRSRTSAEPQKAHPFRPFLPHPGYGGYREYQ